MTDPKKGILMAEMGRKLYENLVKECQSYEQLDEPDKILVSSIAAGYIMAHSASFFPLESIDGYLEHWFEGVKVNLEDMRPDFKAKRESKKDKDDVITIRITNRGAATAVMMDIDILT